MRKELKDAVEITNRCQRNWDRSKPIFDEDLETLIHVAKRSPAKQNETHYKVFVIKDPDTIYKIYRKTKHYALWRDIDEIEDDGKTNTADMNVRNSQVWASVLFGFCDDWDQSVARSAIHAIMDEKEEVKVMPEMLNLLGCSKENFKKLLKLPEIRIKFSFKDLLKKMISPITNRIVAYKKNKVKDQLKKAREIEKQRIIQSSLRKELLKKEIKEENKENKPNLNELSSVKIKNTEKN